MIRVGFIGTGGIARAHLDCLKAFDDVELVALCDINKEKLDERLRVYGGEGYADYNDMLDKARPDSVWLCTPPSVRRAPLVACADRGVPVFCEKPVGLNTEDSAKTALELAERKALVQVGYVFRSMPVIDFLRSAMADDSIHAVQSIYANNAGITLGLPRWMYDKSKSGGFLMDQATHNFDLLRYLFGEASGILGMSANPVRKKEGDYTVEETVSLAFALGGKLLATHTHSTVADKWRNEITISGEKRLYRLDSNAGRLCAEGACQSPPEPIGGELTSHEDGKGYTFQQGPGSIMIHENRRFLDQVASGDWSRNPCDFDDGFKTLQLTLECDRVASLNHIR